MPDQQTVYAVYALCYGKHIQIHIIIINWTQRATRMGRMRETHDACWHDAGHKWKRTFDTHLDFIGIEIMLFSTCIIWMFKIFSLLEFIQLILFLLFAAPDDSDMVVVGVGNIIFFFRSALFARIPSGENLTSLYRPFGSYSNLFTAHQRTWRWSLAAPATVYVGKQIVNILHSI